MADHPRRGAFARWLLRQYRLAGHTEDVEAHLRIVTIAAIALDAGLTPEQTAALARTLTVTPQEVTAAYTAEKRHRTLEKLLDHPGLAELDAHLDDIARR
ncbi:hypothetical protein AB0C93_33835 [Streptomyces sp. NPDC048518]|uniref:hypothetical protein n=1 Tax=Streptomyces sp. NPDC048518 TaxID=3155029 RepID=UPI0034071F58